MYTNQFINIYDTLPTSESSAIVPVAGGDAFFFTQADSSATCTHKFDLVSADTTTVLQSNIDLTKTITTGKGHIVLKELTPRVCSRVRYYRDFGVTQQAYAFDYNNNISDDNSDIVYDNSSLNFVEGHVYTICGNLTIKAGWWNAYHSEIDWTTNFDAELYIYNEDDELVGKCKLESQGLSAEDYTFKFTALKTTNQGIYITCYMNTIDGDTPDGSHSYLYMLGQADMSVNEEETVGYSNLLKPIATSDSESSKVEYWCDEDEFGIPFQSTGKHIVQHLPILLQEPQLVTKEETYEKLSGEQVVLYSTIKKEYTMETDYIPEEWHDKLVVALSCDHVKINDVAVRKNGDYSIDWEKYQKLEDETKTAKAEAKVQQNFNSRNSN